MRVAALTVNGFRGWTSQASLDLDSDAVIVIAKNGQGKTSLLDAIMWSLTGFVPRLGNDEALISKYSETGQAFVSITLKDPRSEHALEITRLFDGTSQNVQVNFDGGMLTGAAATQHIISALWPTALSAPKPADALLSAFTKSIYLQQDLVRDFVQDQSEQARFNAVSEIIGTGRVTELQLHLERAKTAWTKATNERSDENNGLRKRLLAVRDQLSGMIGRPVDLDRLENRWADWWREAGPIIGEQARLSIASPHASSSLDRALKQLYALELALGRQMDEVRQTLAFLQTKPSGGTTQTTTIIAGQLKAIETEIKMLTEDLRVLQGQQRHFEAAQTHRMHAESEMIQLMRLALRHLTAHCPVCDQKYDARATKWRLEEILKRTGLHTTPDEDFQKSIEAKLIDLSTAEQARTLLLSEQQQEFTANERLLLWEAERTRRIQAFPGKFSDEEITQAIINKTYEIREETRKIERLRKTGEEIAFQLASSAEAQRRAELLKEAARLAEVVERADTEFAERTATGELAGKILNALREAAADLVAEQLREIGPVLQRIYETCDPHPALKAVRLVSSMYRGRGKLGTEIVDPDIANVRSDDPARILSSSQVNVLAVSLFLALNLTIRSLPLQCAILDDPLQSLDDLNLLGLVDVLRHVKDQRQLFISTHDVRFGALLKRKLRPVEAGKRTRIIEIGDWCRQGPDIVQYDALHELSQSASERSAVK